MPKFWDGNKKENNDTMFYKDCLYLIFLFLCGQGFFSHNYASTCYATFYFVRVVRKKKKKGTILVHVTL